MKIKSIGFKGFRNLKEDLISTDASVVVVTGKNGVGKTSFIECIYSALLLSSFKCQTLSDAINYDSLFYQTRCSLNKHGQQFEVFSYCDRNQKSIKVNDEKVFVYSRLFELFSVAVLSYDDKKIVTGGPEERRKYINQVSCLLNPNLVDILKQYAKVIRDRNKALKDERQDILDALDEKLAELGLEIIRQRNNLIPNLLNHINDIYRNVFSLPAFFSIDYKSNCNNVTSKEDLLSLIRANREKDEIMQYTTIGPHRDEFLFLYDGHVVKEYLSTGQVRLLSIILKLAMMQTIRDDLGYSPIVLVDDVLLELDEEKKIIFFKYLLSYRQVFYTFLPSEDFYHDYCDDLLVYDVEDGVVKVRNAN